MNEQIDELNQDDYERDDQDFRLADFPDEDEPYLEITAQSKRLF